MVYLPRGHSSASQEPNIVILNYGQTAGTAHFVLLDEDLDFSPKVPITTEQGVYLSRDVEYWNEKPDGGYYPQGLTSCLPYDVTLASETTKVYAPQTIETVEGVTTVTFAEVEDKMMKAYTPYFLTAEGDREIDFSVEAGMTIGTKPGEEGSAVGAFVFKGTTASIPNSVLYDPNHPVYLYQTDAKWHKVPQNEPNAYIKPFRAYFQAEGNSSARTHSMLLDDTRTTAVNAVLRTVDNDGTERYYDLSGRQLNGKPQKGMYIHNGKKYFNR